MKLPIKIDSYVMSECWTFYEMAIIQTHPNCLDWLSGHMGLIMFDDYNVIYGNERGRFGMEYYSDILQCEEIDISAFKKGQIIEIIRKEIDAGNYVILDCNYNGLYGKAEPNTHDIHEELIYGYDDNKKVMYATWLSDSRFEEYEFSYEDILKGYELTLRWFLERPEEIYYRRAWFYPLTRITLRKDLHCIDPLYKFIVKLEDEYSGGKCVKNHINDVGVEETVIHYCGIAIIQRILNLCNNAINTDIELYNKMSGKVAVAYVKMHEHCRIILDCVRWSYNKMNINSMYAEELYNQYSDLVEQFQLLYLLCYKYRLRPKRRILRSITNKTYICLKSYREILYNLRKFILGEYAKYVSISE